LCTASAPDLVVLVSLSAGKNALGVARVPHTDFEEAEAALAGEPPAMTGLAERVGASIPMDSDFLWPSAFRLPRAAHQECGSMSGCLRSDRR
jgi:hypothetical protein